MPRDYRTKAELEKLPSYFEFLAGVPYVPVTDPAFQDDCPVCKEPFEWRYLPRQTMNRPVRLVCGHTIGIQCLARWMLSSNFDGCCFYCRTVVIDPALPQVRNQVVTAALTDLEVLCLFDGQITADKKLALLRIFEKSLESRWGEEVQDRERLMMLWEELLDSMCDEFSEPVPALNRRIPIAQVPEPEAVLRFPIPEPRLLAAARQFIAAQGPEHLNQREVRVACFFNISGTVITILAFQLVFFWDRCYGGTGLASLESLATIRNCLCIHFLMLAVADGLPIPFLELLSWNLWFFFTGVVLVATLVGLKAMAFLIYNAVVASLEAIAAFFEGA